MTSAARRLPDPADLTLREKLAQLIVVRIGSNLPPICRLEEDEERIARLLGQCPVGGLMLLNGGPGATATLKRLQAAAPQPLLVAADIERGVGQQMHGYTLFPHAMAFDRLGNDSAATVTQYARILARQARHAGIHISFGPVADVNTNPRNPIIATRAYSERSGRAAELVRAYVSAAEAAGLLTTAKHFPGHGATHEDSHHALPRDARPLDDLQACDLPPFQAAIDAGCALVMSAHIAYPAIDPSGQPATVSPYWLQKVLRERLGFRGVVCSDSLLMAAVRDRFATEEQLALAALTAGVDLLLDVADPARLVDRLCECVERGRLDPRRVDEACRRVGELKQRAFAGDAPQAPYTADDKRAAAQLARQVARRAVEVIDGAARLPFDPRRPLAAVLMKTFETPLDPPEQPLADALRERFAEVQYVQIGPQADPSAYERARQLAAARQLLVAVIVRPAAWHAFGLLPQQRRLVRLLTAGHHAVLASLGVPYVLDDYPEAAARICAFSDVPVSQHALAELLLSSH